jgi:YegS/Rv2252/BmrU family lipid kinase
LSKDPDSTKEEPGAGAAAGEGWARRLLVIHNPVAGWRRRHRLWAVIERLEHRGCLVDLRETTRRGDAEAFARVALADNYDRMVVAGGDGTINEAINGLADRRLPLAVVPLGTANVLAAEIGLGVHSYGVARAIADGPAATVALGRIRGRDGRPRRFSMMAGIGFDAHVVARVDPVLKRWTGKFAYVVASLLQLREHRDRLYDVRVDGRRYRAASVIVAKGHFYGGKFVVAPAARLHEPYLHVCLFGRTGRWAVIRYALALFAGQLHRLPDITLIRALRVEIDGPAGEPVQVDGDLDGELPVTIDIDDHILRLAVPADGARRGARLATAVS